MDSQENMGNQNAAAPDPIDAINGSAAAPNQNEFQREDAIIMQETQHVLDITKGDPNVTPNKLANMIVENVQFALNATNNDRTKNAKMRIPNNLRPSQIALCILSRSPVAVIQCSDETTDPERNQLGIYTDSGKKAGLYITEEKYFRNLIHQYNHDASTQDVKEIIQRIKDMAPQRHRTEDPDLIAVENGIINYKTKQLEPFDPKYIFLAKSAVKYVITPPRLPVIQNPDGTLWDPESWMQSLSDDKDIVNLLWQVIGGIIRPFVNWDKSVWLYSNQGNNGKGTLCALMRNIAGKSSCASISLDAFSKEFQLETLLSATSIVVDENNVGAYIDSCANLKAVITSDVIQVNRKHKTPISFRFKGVMVQCINDYPRIRDTSDSFYRRQIFIPFEKCFTGRERPYIKHDYLERQEVLEYILWRVINMPDYYRFDEPVACKHALAEYKEYNNPVEQFLGEIFEQTQWDMLPFKFLYDVYKPWYSETMPSGKPQGRNNFIKDVQAIVQAGHFPDWTYVNQPVHPGHRMDNPEPLILQYNVKDWANNHFDRTDPQNFCRTPLKTSYKGLVRFGSAGTSPDDSTKGVVISDNLDNNSDSMPGTSNQI